MIVCMLGAATLLAVAGCGRDAKAGEDVTQCQRDALTVDATSTVPDIEVWRARHNAGVDKYNACGGSVPMARLEP